MSEEAKPYSPRYIQAWSVLSIVLGLLLIAMFVFGDDFLHTGQVIWNLLRWLASPFI